MNWKEHLLRTLARLGLWRPGNLHYIGGSDVLPAPLSREEERACIARLAEGDQEASATLIEHNLRLVVYIARRFENTGINIEDLISIGTIGLIIAVHGGKPGQAILSRADLVAYITKVASEGAARVAHGEQGATHVSRSLEGKLLRQHVERIRAVVYVVGAPAHAAAIRVRHEIGHVPVCTCAIVQMQQKAIRIRLHLIRRGTGREREDPGRVIEAYGHGRNLSNTLG